MLAAVLSLAVAQTMPMPAPVACATPMKPSPELAGWTSPVAMTAATTRGELGTATLRLGASARATLAPTPRVAYPVAPAHPGSAATHGGLFAFTVTDAGTYRVALGAPAWVDLVAGSRTLPSSAHAHGPDCTGIRKQVDFALSPGRYLLQIAGASEPVLKVMVARLPV